MNLSISVPCQFLLSERASASVSYVENLRTQMAPCRNSQRGEVGIQRSNFRMETASPFQQKQQGHILSPVLGAILAELIDINPGQKAGAFL